MRTTSYVGTYDVVPDCLLCAHHDDMTCVVRDVFLGVKIRIFGISCVRTHGTIDWPVLSRVGGY